MKDKLKILIPCVLLALLDIVFRFFYVWPCDSDFWKIYASSSILFYALTALYFLYLAISKRKQVLGLISFLLFLLLSAVLVEMLGKVFRLPVAVYSIVFMYMVLFCSIVITSYMTFQNRRLMIPILILIGILMLGEFSRRMHWPGATIAILIGYFGLFLTYSARFVLKSKKQTLDSVSWILVSVFTLVTPFVMLHWTGNVEFNNVYCNYIKEPIIWLGFLLLIIQIDLRKSIGLTQKV